MTALTFLLAHWPWIVGGYVGMAWLMYGVLMAFGNVPPGQERHMMIRSLGIWPIALLVQTATWAVALLRWTIDTLAAGSGWLFRPQGGKLARDWGELKMLGRHWKARFLGHDPYAAPVVHPEQPVPTGPQPSTVVTVTHEPGATQ